MSVKPEEAYPRRSGFHERTACLQLAHSVYLLNGDEISAFVGTNGSSRQRAASPCTGSNTRAVSFTFQSSVTLPDGLLALKADESWAEPFTAAHSSTVIPTLMTTTQVCEGSRA